MLVVLHEGNPIARTTVDATVHLKEGLWQMAAGNGQGEKEEWVWVEAMHMLEVDPVFLRDYA